MSSTLATTLFADRLAEAMERTGSLACVGLDPVVEKIPKAAAVVGGTPAGTLRRFCEGVLDAVAGQVPVVKFQSGCFERHGPEGVAVLNDLITRAKSQGLLALLDAKRGDIGVTAEHYAHAAFHVAKADALTVNPYLGMDTLEPYFSAGSAAIGLFVLVRTSNPGSDGVQNLSLADGRTLAEAMGGMVAAFGGKFRSDNGLSSVGAVVGATKAVDAARLRAVMPDQVFLVPGYGAQGGTADDIRPMLRQGKTISRRGVLVTASRSVIYPANPGQSGVSWMENIRTAAVQLNRELAQILK